MVGEFLCLAIFLLAALTGVARFRFQPYWDAVSLMISKGANYSGTFLLAACVLNYQDASYLVPLSLLILMHGTAFIFKNNFPQIIGLPLVIGEMLMSFVFSDIQNLFRSPVTLMLALIFHMGFMGLMFKLLLRLHPQDGRLPAWSPYSLSRKLQEHRRIYSWPKPAS
ncbi:hypothetical protein [Oligoflexus tunisiensis]|uniref:hypothetical protein n=1 Tax=Oligoflexus tunisiensis TaxID=708132 RepID=UPI00114CC64B|nr:hypothetical protein [Oligoflexus tunisiensis]